MEGVFLNSTLNISVHVRAMNQYDTFTARYAILNGSIDKGKELNISAVDAIMSIGNVNLFGYIAIIYRNGSSLRIHWERVYLSNYMAPRLVYFSLRLAYCSAQRSV